MITHQWHDLQNQLAAEQVGPSVLTSPAQQLLLPATLGCCLGNPTREAKGAPAGSVSAASVYTAALTSLSASAEVELFVSESLDTQDTLTAEEALQLAGSSPAPPYAYATPAAPIPAPPRRARLKRPAPPGLASAPRAPKRVFTSPYTVFCKEQRPRLPPTLRNTERERLLGQQWRALSQTERALFVQRAATADANAARPPMQPPHPEGRQQGTPHLQLSALGARIAKQQLQQQQQHQQHQWSQQQQRQYQHQQRQHQQQEQQEQQEQQPFELRQHLQQVYPHYHQHPLLATAAPTA